MADARPSQAVQVFTDGACLGNPGPGGYAAILVYGETRKEIVGGFRRTTNNRMELTAAIKALEQLKRPCTVHIFSDSEYLVNSVSKGWARNWRQAGWKRPRTGIVPNWDLWNRLLELLAVHTIEFHWVRGHAGHIENERCDVLATGAAAAGPTEIDSGYESPRLPGAIEART